MLASWNPVGVSSRSDLDQTLRSDEKWKQYEVQQAVEQGVLLLPATAEKPESRCPIASLSLETCGKTLSNDDIEVLRHEVSVQAQGAHW